MVGLSFSWEISRDSVDNFPFFSILKLFTFVIKFPVDLIVGKMLSKQQKNLLVDIEGTDAVVDDWFKSI